MIFEIDFMYIAISACLWLYAIRNLSGAIAQIDNTTIKKEITNKMQASDFFGHFAYIFFFSVMYLTNGLTADNMSSLYYFVIFVVLHHLARIIYGFKKYPDNIKTYSMWEIYINMILYAGTVGWMIYLWAL